jgi:ribulose-5-phosphate 4-epimerase/fuculose-1-phosphate aldolase
MTTFAAERDELCRIGQSLFERGYVHASAGNISLRLPQGQGVLITPTDSCLGQLKPSRLAHVADDDALVGGGRPSKALVLHKRIYAADPQANCVLHTHSTQLVAATLEGLWREGATMPALTPYFVMKVGRVPLMPYRRPGDPAVAELVETAMQDGRTRTAPIRAVMLDRLGPVVWHASAAEAMATLEELEETARLWRTCGGRATPLTDAQIDELRTHFGAHW